MSNDARLQHIPTNIITGFLGVGKTTAIRQLLKQKPVGERWAILVNEFGEVGIDASLIAGDHSEESGIFIREVPGGCMCCAAGLPMQIALNMLLARAKPDRLLIEPTGLGHPKEVIGVLSNQVYRDVLDLQATLTLVDARKLSDKRYRDNDTYQQQLAIADIIVANKSDLYADDDYQQLVDYLEQSPGLAEKKRGQVEQGKLEIQWLSLPNLYITSQGGCSHVHDTPASIEPVAPEIPESGYLRVDNQGEGYFSSGWIFSSSLTFNYLQLYALLSGIQAERLKGVFITDEGVIGFNKVDDILSAIYLDDADESRVELIVRDQQQLEDVESQLKACLDGSVSEMGTA